MPRLTREAPDDFELRRRAARAGRPRRYWLRCDRCSSSTAARSVFSVSYWKSWSLYRITVLLTNTACMSMTSIHVANRSRPPVHPLPTGGRTADRATRGCNRRAEVRIGREHQTPADVGRLVSSRGRPRKGATIRGTVRRSSRPTKIGPRRKSGPVTPASFRCGSTIAVNRVSRSPTSFPGKRCVKSGGLRLTIGRLTQSAKTSQDKMGQPDRMRSPQRGRSFTKTVKHRVAPSCPAGHFSPGRSQRSAHSRRQRTPLARCTGHARSAQ